jgi:nicotinate-nucleotide adenylyltransferase
MKRSSDSWTIDTINEIKSISPDHYFFFISGSEGFLKIRTWKLYKKLLDALSFIVILRKEEDNRAVEQLLKEECIPYCDTLPAKEYPAKKSTVFIYAYQSEHLRISSTFIRHQIKLSGYRDIEDFVGGEVKKIMEEYKLYEK